MRLPRMQAALAVLTSGVLGVVLVAGGVTTWADPSAEAPLKVMPFLVGLVFIALTCSTLVMQFWRPRVTVQKITANSSGALGMTLKANRVRDMSLLAVAGTFAVATGVGTLFAEGGWQVALIALTMLAVLPVLAMLTAAGRPRWLRLTADGIEAAAIRSHARVSWDDLSVNMFADLKFGSGQSILRLNVPPNAPSYQELWRNRWQARFKTEVPLGGALDIEFEAMGVDEAALASLVNNLIWDRRIRSHIDWNVDKVARLLLDPQTSGQTWLSTSPSRDSVADTMFEARQQMAAPMYTPGRPAER